jgi:hypothetical protein
MAVSRALRRLLHIRGLEEEQGRLALESALGERSRIKEGLVAAAERDRGGRRLVETGIRTGQLVDRVAGLEEGRVAGLQAAALAPRLETMEGQVALARQEFLDRRVERRQAEALLSASEAQEAAEAGRRGQQALDEWYRSRLRRSQTESPESDSTEIDPAGRRS